MTDTRFVQLCDAICKFLNSRDFSQEFEAKRLWMPDYRREDLETLQVGVTTPELEESLIARGASQEDAVIQIGVLVACDPADVLRVDRWLKLTEEIRDALRCTTFANFGWDSTSQKPLFSPEHLKEKREFRAVITFVYKTGHRI
jgi:hypothetical protein